MAKIPLFCTIRYSEVLQSRSDEWLQPDGSSLHLGKEILARIPYGQRQNVAVSAANPLGGKPPKLSVAQL